MSSDIADAIVWASGGHVDGVPDNTHPAEVISMSLGGFGSCDSNTQQAINTAVANGSTVVVAAGNDAIDAAQFTPASCSNVITVGATRITGGIAFYSNFGSVVDLSGPGGGQDQDTGNGGWDGLVLSTGYSGKTTPTSGQYKYLAMPAPRWPRRTSRPWLRWCKARWRALARHRSTHRNCRRS